MFKQILVAIDTSDYSYQVLPTAVEVARKFQSEVFVLHVSEHDHGRAAVFTTESPAEANMLVAKAVKSLRDAGVSAKGEVHDVAAGHVAKDIIETAHELQSDMIVMGSRGLSDIQGLLLGSVTHKVLQLAQVAVLVARGPIPVTVRAEQPMKAAQAAAY
ncbi:MAG TPA: universal stress protein [Candidatus Sulfotelmatobacter sp.]|nr:universal stress protein [Candidatus Sulfotelmatobacter sp.]